MAAHGSGAWEGSDIGPAWQSRWRASYGPGNAVIRMRYLDTRWVECLGQTVSSNTPTFAMARRLIEQGYPPDAEVEVLAVSGTPSLRGPLGAFAALSVEENAGVRFVSYQPFPRDRARPGRPHGVQPSADASQAGKAVQRAGAGLEVAP